MVARAVLYLMALMTSTASLSSAAVFHPHSFTLDNGLRVVVIEQNLGDAVCHMIWYKVGGGDDPQGQSGLAHFVEHLMFKATDTLEVGEFSRFVTKHGGRDNAFTSYDYTAYFQIVARPQLGDVMSMEADRMKNLRLRDEDILTERNVILEERKSRSDNNPSALLHEAAAASLYNHHPYGTPLIGWRHEIARLNGDHVADFYRRYYHPNNAIVILSGAITRQEAQSLAEFYYGDLERGAVTPRQRVTDPPIITERTVRLTDDRVQQPTLRYYWRLPKHRHDEDRASDEAFSILTHYLGGGSSSRLYEQWVVDDGVAVSVSLSFDSWGRDYDDIVLSVIPVADVTLERLDLHIRSQWRAIMNETIATHDMERVRQHLLAEAVYSQDSLMAPAYLFGIALTTGGTLADVEEFPQRINDVTTEQLRDAAAFLHDTNPHVTAQLDKSAHDDAAP